MDRNDMHDDADGSAPVSGPEHYWSMEHHSDRQPPAASAPGGVASPAAPVRSPAPSTGRRRLAVAAALAATLVVGAGSVAVAQVGGAAPDEQAQQVQPVQPVRGDAGRTGFRGAGVGAGDGFDGGPQGQADGRFGGPR